MPLPFDHSRTIHLIGIAGAEGSSVAAFLLAQGYTNLVGHDHGPESGFKESFFRFHDWMTDGEKERAFAMLRDSGMEFRFGERYLEGIEIPPLAPSPSSHQGEGGSFVDAQDRLRPGEGTDIVFVPQSWFRYDFNAPLRTFFQPDLQVRPEFQDQIWSMTKLYLTLFPGKVIGVTGSNGKSTTTAMIAGIVERHLQAPSPRPSPTGGEGEGTLRTPHLYWGGNDRKNPQPLNALTEATADDVLVLEMSNRQLSLGLGKSPNVAVITNIVPNHLDDHGTFEAYVRVKHEIVRYQTEGDTAVLNWNNAASRQAKDIAMGGVVFFDLNQEGVPVPEGFVGTRREGNDLVSYDADGRRLTMASTEDIGVAGEHNVENALAAIAAVAAFGIPAETVQSALRAFGGLDHRLELVAERDGVKYINDSSGCSPLNIVMAVKTLFPPSPPEGGQLILIMGGYRKNPLPGEFFPVAEVTKDPRVKHLYLIGSIQEMLEEELVAGGVEETKITRCTGLAEAFEKAKDMAQSGDTVALTPGCESFGEFRDYRERGERFRLLVCDRNTPSQG